MDSSDRKIPRQNSPISTRSNRPELHASSSPNPQNHFRQFPKVWEPLRGYKINLGSRFGWKGFVRTNAKAIHTRTVVPLCFRLQREMRAVLLPRLSAVDFRSLCWHSLFFSVWFYFGKAVGGGCNWISERVLSVPRRGAVFVDCCA